MKDLKTLVQTILELHDNADFNGLAAYIHESEITSQAWFTESRFKEVCEAIKQELGQLVSLEHIDTLHRKTSQLTLWKARYNQNQDEVLWQITFDTSSQQIKLMYISWEHD